MSQISTNPKKLSSWKISGGSHGSNNDESMRQNSFRLAQKFSPMKSSLAESKIFSSSKDKIRLLMNHSPNGNDPIMTPRKSIIVNIPSDNSILPKQHVTLHQSVLNSSKQLIPKKQTTIIHHLESTSPTKNAQSANLMKFQQNRAMISQLKQEFIAFKRRILDQLMSQKGMIAKVVTELTKKIDQFRIQVGNHDNCGRHETTALKQDNRFVVLKELQLNSQVTKLQFEMLEKRMEKINIDQEAINQVPNEYEQIKQIEPLRVVIQQPQQPIKASTEAEPIPNQIIAKAKLDFEDLILTDSPKEIVKQSADQLQTSPIANSNQIINISNKFDSKDQILNDSPKITRRQEIIKKQQKVIRSPLEKCNQIGKTIGMLSEINSSPISKNKSIQKNAIQQYKQKLREISRSNELLMSERPKKTAQDHSKIKGNYKLDKLFNTIQKLKQQVNQIRNISDMNLKKDKIINLNT